jgi:uncharacterized membrane protein YedE/YeeE
MVRVGCEEGVNDGIYTNKNTIIFIGVLIGVRAFRDIYIATNDLIIFVSTTGDTAAFGRLLTFTLVELPLNQLSSNLAAGWTGRPALSRLMASGPAAL